MADMTEGAMAQVPADHPLMVAWKAYQETDDFKNSYRWATSAIEHVVLPEPKDQMANRWTEEHYRQFVLGSMWAAFMAGYSAGIGRAVSISEAPR